MVAVTVVESVAPGFAPVPATGRHRLPTLSNVLVWSVTVTVPILLAVLVALHLHTGGTDLTSWWYGNAFLALVLGVPGVLVARKRPGNAVGWLMCSASLTSAICGAGREYLAYGFLGGTAPGWMWIGWFTDSLYAVSMASLPLMLMLFPDGKPLSRRARPVLALPVLALVLSWSSSLFVKGGVDVRGRTLTNPAGQALPAWLPNAAMGLGTMAFFASLLAAILLLVLRFRRATDDARLQMKWVVWAGGLAAVELGTEVIPNNVIAPYTGTAATALLTAAVSIAILRHRLFDIDVVINRTLVFGLLTVLVVGGYVALVSVLGAAVGEPVRLGRGLVVTALLAAAFSPLRQHVQRGVDRMLYGERRNPYGVLAQLGRQLDASSGRSVLAVVVDTVTQTLKLPYAAILDPAGGVLVQAGRCCGAPMSVPLAYQGEPVGTLLVESRTRATHFGAAEQRLLADLARQIGAAVHAVNLTEDLQASRRRLVTAKEEERRRLRRDLHDGLGPKLAALALQLDAARSLVDTRPAASKTMLTAVKGDIRETIDDIRRLVYGLRPPALDELGLLGAVRDCAARFDSSATGGVTVTVRVPAGVPALPAAVEVAAYWIVNEAITNVVRHANATHCVVELSCADGLRVRVTDDGDGLPPQWHPGVGTGSMAERAAELGGYCRLGAPARGRGTDVDARLPV